jgi:hypothetical protein
MPGSGIDLGRQASNDAWVRTGRVTSDGTASEAGGRRRRRPPGRDAHARTAASRPAWFSVCEEAPGRRSREISRPDADAPGRRPDGGAKLARAGPAGWCMRARRGSCLAAWHDLVSPAASLACGLCRVAPTSRGATWLRCAASVPIA